MTNRTLAQAYVIKAEKRLKALQVLYEEGAFSDVVREAQEIVELSLKAMLRAHGVDPPRWHDVGPTLLEMAERFPSWVQPLLPELARISHRLRREREFAFYGEEDLIPTEEYDEGDAAQAMEEAQQVVRWAKQLVPLG